MDTLPDNKPPAAAAPSTLRQYAGMGTELAGSICGLTLAGYWFDRHYQTGNKGTIVGVIIGVVGGMYNFLRRALKMSRQAEREYRDVHGGRHDDDRTTPTTGA